MVVVTEEGLVGDCYFQQGDLQAPYQRLDLGGQALVIQNEIKQQRHQVNHIVIGLVQGMDGFAMLTIEQF